MMVTVQKVVLVLLAPMLMFGCKDAPENASADDKGRDYAPVVEAIDQDVVRAVLEERGYEVEEEWSQHNLSQAEADQIAKEVGLGTDATSVSSKSLGATMPDDSYVTVTITNTGKPNYREKGGTGWNSFMGHAFIGAGKHEVSVMVFGDQLSEDQAKALSLEILDQLMETAGFEP